MNSILKIGHFSTIPYIYLKNRLLRNPLSLNIEVTLKCNARCRMCDYWKTKSEHHLQDYSPVVNKIGPLWVTLSGGEPLLRSDLTDVISNLKEKCRLLFVSMTTNGSLLTEDKAGYLYDAGLDGITISLDFIDERHDDQRGIRGLYNHIAGVIPKLRTIGFNNVQVHTTVSNLNLDEIISIARRAYQWGANFALTTFSYTKVGERDMWINPDRLGILEDRINELIKLKTILGNITNSTQYLKRIPKYFRNGDIGGCLAGKRWIQVTPDGFLKACSEFEAVCHFEDYRGWGGLPTPDCGKCWFKCRGEAQTRLTPGRIMEYIKLFL